MVGGFLIFGSNDFGGSGKPKYGGIFLAVPGTAKYGGIFLAVLKYGGTAFEGCE